MQPEGQVEDSQRGYAMAALLVGMSVMAVALSVALPVWHTAARREREAELIFRGEQYARAVMLFQRKYAGAFPPNLDLLLTERMLRKKYKDPMTKDGEFQLLYAGQQIPGQPGPQGQSPPGAQTQAARAGGPPPQAGRTGGAPPPAGPQTGVMGVASKSTETGLRQYNGRERYNEWTFVATLATTQAGAPTGAQIPGQPGSGGLGGQPTQPPGRGGPVPPGRLGAPGQPGGAGPGRGAPGPGRGFPQPGSPFPETGSPFPRMGLPGRGAPR